MSYTRLITTLEQPQQQEVTLYTRASIYPEHTVLTLWKYMSQLEVRSGQSDDGSFVKLVRDGGRQRKHLRQVLKLFILFFSPGSSCVLRLVFHSVTQVRQILVIYFASRVSER